MEFLGLGERALKVYQEMLHKPGIGVEDLSEELGWPPDRIHRALDELAEQQLVRPSWEASGNLQPVSPQIGLMALIARREVALTRSQQDLAQCKVLAAQLEDDFLRSVRAHDTSEVERLIGIDSIRARIEQFSYESRSEVMSVAPDGAQTHANRDAGRPLNQMLLDRGVNLRTIYLESIRNDRESLKYAHWLMDSGAQIRTLATVPSRMLIFDREIAIAPVNTDASGSGALVVKGSAFVVAMCSLFDMLWRESLPLVPNEPTQSPDDSASDKELAILGLLADGHTDETVARRLGVSVRTTRRITADLMSRTGSRSRFELAVQAAQRGWIATP
ncbi:helix-turn-helix transcriptional regulator [Streptomyces spiroverticillatus]|uniref:Helix-turn-helix transcriptional regulator n=1 Tax=Streptomyces finlayi TaxID=67296 RepID=A0A918WXY8_9ACTN|nr:helix-turn-helix transcriptional regulator [Streptomyces finlayi]GHA11646.1 helix-turn-helix transcriptional regulator [Streptomyces spiroverticillatus]GHC94917.1 helix-turn-helix transcriptional regulator [Streptomyces finlayi]